MSDAADLAASLQVLATLEPTLVASSAFGARGVTDVGIARLPRATAVGPVKGLWAATTLCSEKMHVHKRFHGDVDRADTAHRETQ